MSEPADPPTAENLVPREFQQLWIAILRRAPNPPQMSAKELERSHVGHLTHLRKLSDTGVLLVAGPFSEQDDDSHRGICVLRASSKTEVRALVDADPAVQDGRFKVDLMKWSFEKGRLAFPMARPQVT